MTATNQTTLAAMQAGNPRLAIVIAVDGYNHLFSNAPQSAVQTAWASTDWATKTVIGGVTIELDNQQKLNPWNPFEGGGKLVFRVLPDSTDQFGIDIARTDDGAETLLEETVDRKQPLFVGFADGFDLIGEGHVGTECFSWGFISGRTFKGTPGLEIGSNRGLYVAHGVKDSTTTYGAIRFAEHHRVATQDNGVRFAPIVSEQPRTWVGRRVSVWAHVYDPSTQTLNTKANALCIFIGDLTEPQDTETGHTECLAEHLLDKIPNTTLLRDQWTATVDYGLNLQAGQRFRFQDHIDGLTTKIATPLVVVASGASGTNEVDAGQYAPEELASVLTAWLGGEVAAGRIHGNYSITSPDDTDGTPHTTIHYFFPGATTTSCNFRFTWPGTNWAKKFGYPGLYYNNFDTCGEHHAAPSTLSVEPFAFASADVSFTLQIGFEDQTGTFISQNDTMPALARQAFQGENPIPEYGLFMLECDTPMLLLGTIVDGNTLRRIRVLNTGFGTTLSGYDALQNASVPLGSGAPKLRQVFVHEAPFKTMMKWLFYSTGTEGYNHDELDVLPPGQGLAIPYDLLGDDFEQSCDAMPGANDTVTLVLEKPRKLSDLFKADLVMRNAHLVFREGKFKFVSWTTPSDAVVTSVLDDSNKAEPTDSRISHRTVSVLDSSWVKNFVKINYNRDVASSVGGGEDLFLATPLILEDATSIDDMGGVPSPITLDLRNVYNDTDQIGQGVRALAAGFLSWMPWWSRPLWKIRRSIAPTHYEGFGVGDTPAVTDSHVRDPQTGQRGITTRPGLVVGHRYQLHSAPPPQKLRFTGEVDIVFLHNDRTFAYAPAAEVDETANTGGFTAGYDGNLTLQFKLNEHSEADGDAYGNDVAPFASGDDVFIVEIDPSDPAVPLFWERTINTIDTGNSQVVLSGSLPGFDAAKRYRMIYGGYPSVQSSQTIKSFQAGENKTIAEVSPPDVYGAQTTSIAVTEYDHTRTPELLANISYGPNVGAARDCAYDKELALLIDNMMDHQTRRSGAVIASSSASSNSSVEGWKLLAVEMHHVGHLIYGGRSNRYLWAAPRWGTMVLGVPPQLSQLRIWISGYPPSGTGTTNISGQTPGYTIKSPSAFNEWNIWSGPTAMYTVDTPKAYPLGNFNGHEYVFIIVEGTRYTQYYSLAQLSESERIEG